MDQSQNRANCWSITINNPVETDYKLQLPAKWKLIGQIEKGGEGTEHFQGMLQTPQIRFSAVKKLFPRAHIEIAKNKLALEKYVRKEETRIASVDDNVSSIPTLFDYQHTIASRWNPVRFTEFTERYPANELAKIGLGEVALLYVDELVAEDIENGMVGVEYIAINPMWRSAWKRFYNSMIKREQKIMSARSIEDGIQEAEDDENQTHSETSSQNGDATAQA